MRNQYQLLIRAEGTSGPIRQKTYGDEDRLEVRDLSMRMMTLVRAREISLYRHTLYLDGTAYQILNVVRQFCA